MAGSGPVRLVDRAVFALHATSGGWMLVAVRKPSDAQEATVLARSPRPAGDPSKFAWAWADLSRGELGLLGPVGSVRARVQTDSGRVDVPLQDGAAMAPVTPSVAEAGRVEFLDATGRSLAATVVAPYDDPSALPSSSGPG